MSEAWARRLWAGTSKLGLDVMCAAMVQVGKDMASLLPGFARCLGLACGLVGISKAIENGGLERPVRKVTGESVGAPVAGYGLPMPAEEILRIAEAVQRGSEVEPVAHGVLEAGSVLEDGQGLLNMAEQ